MFTKNFSLVASKCAMLRRNNVSQKTSTYFPFFSLWPLLSFRKFFPLHSSLSCFWHSALWCCFTDNTVAWKGSWIALKMRILGLVIFIRSEHALPFEMIYIPQRQFFSLSLHKMLLLPCHPKLFSLRIYFVGAWFECPSVAPEEQSSYIWWLSWWIGMSEKCLTVLIKLGGIFSLFSVEYQISFCGDF